jgi:phosphotriesterase-related protein
VECTPSHIGKNVALLKRLSEESEINIITNTGYYAAVDKKYLPDEAYSKTAEQLADIWEEEFTQGIGNTGIRPGFIKLGVGSGPLDEVERKIVKAGFLLSSRSGLTVYVHTGGDQSILSQAGLAEQMKFNFGKLVWVHAQNGTDSTRIAMAKKGMWVSLDGVNVKHLDDYIAMISAMRNAGVLHRLLLSHDDGWSVEKDGDELVLTLFNNGNPIPYNSIERKLVPKLQELEFSREEIELLLVENPGRALAIPR